MGKGGVRTPSRSRMCGPEFAIIARGGKERKTLSRNQGEEENREKQIKDLEREPRLYAIRYEIGKTRLPREYLMIYLSGPII